MFLLFLFINLLGPVYAGLLCMRCTYRAYPRDCVIVSECGDHEECYVLQYIMPNGGILYDSGCKPKTECYSHSGRRDIYSDGRVVACSTCCNSTACNNGGQCGTTPLDYHGGHLCFNCNQQDSPNSCSRVTLCDRDQVCYIGQRLGPLSGTIFYETKCALPKAECASVLPSVFGKRSSGMFCNQCCRDNLCNNKCTTPTNVNPRATTLSPMSTRPKTTKLTTTTPTSTTTINGFPPIITSIQIVNRLEIGADVKVACFVSGYPTPSVGWNAFILDPSISNLHSEGHGHILAIYNYQRINDGKYMCYASNSFGQTSKMITLRA